MRLDSPQINLITRACMKASRSLIRDFGELENLQVSAKGPGDFVSSADKRTEKILIEELQKAHPEYGIITEESGIINKSNTKNKWVIDPREIVDALSIYLKISEEIKLNPNKKFLIFNVVDKKGVKSRRFNIEGSEVININNIQVETIRVSCPEARLTFNVSKDHNYIPIMINKIKE